MEIKLHANASTTPKTRALIRKSTKSVIELAKEFGVHESTIRKWRKRDNFNDRSHVRHNLGQSTSPEEEEIIVCQDVIMIIQFLEFHQKELNLLQLMYLNGLIVS